jgi:predicted TIM-barrel fold metal-dependent hydrolase
MQSRGGQDVEIQLMRRAVPILLVAILSALVSLEGQRAGRGQFRPRPAEGRNPEVTPPTITDYKPRSTLVVPQHQVPRAKFPVVDIHGHPPTLTGPEIVDRIVESMDPLNLRVIVQANGRSGAQLRQSLDAIRASRHPNRVVMFTTLDLRSVGPGSGRTLATQLDADVKAGALGVGEIMKGFGLFIRKSDGTRLKLDEAELDPVWETAARLKIPVFIHVADPAEFFEPMDFKNERWLELSLFPDRRYQDRTRFPSFEELMGERDRLLMKHPNTVFVLAHLGWHGNDLARLGRLFDKHPNLYTEVGAVLYDIGRQPRTAHDFFVKYQDRILFGKDSYQPDEYPYYWRVFETNDEYFDYYRDYHAFWKLYGIGLPDAVLRKVYFANALRIMPGLQRAGFPAN